MSLWLQCNVIHDRFGSVPCWRLISSHPWENIFCFRKKLNVKKETDKCPEKKGMATTWGNTNSVPRSMRTDWERQGKERDSKRRYMQMVAGKMAFNDSSSKSWQTNRRTSLLLTKSHITVLRGRLCFRFVGVGDQRGEYWLSLMLPGLHWLRGSRAHEYIERRNVLPLLHSSRPSSSRPCSIGRGPCWPGEGDHHWPKN